QLLAAVGILPFRALVPRPQAIRHCCRHFSRALSIIDPILLGPVDRSDEPYPLHPRPELHCGKSLVEARRIPVPGSLGQRNSGHPGARILGVQQKGVRTLSWGAWCGRWKKGPDTFYETSCQTGGSLPRLSGRLSCGSTSSWLVTRRWPDT